MDEKWFLTKDGAARTTWLAGPTVHVKISVSTCAPLAEDSRPRVNNVHKVRIARVQIPRVVRPGVEKDGRIQSGNATKLALVRRQVIRHQPSNVRPHAVPNQVQIVRRNSARVMRNVLDQLRNAQAAKAGSPLDLTEAWFRHRRSVVHDDDVVVPPDEVRLAHVRTRRKVATAAEAMNHNFDRMFRVPVGVVQRFPVQHVDQLRVLLGAFGVQVEFDSRMWAAVRFLEAGRGVEHVAGVGLFLGWNGRTNNLDYDLLFC